MMSDGALLDDLAHYVENANRVGFVAKVATDRDAWNFGIHGGSMCITALRHPQQPSQLWI
jgi:hypothetical protein